MDAAITQGGRESCGHLRASGIVHAHEQYLGHLLGSQPIRLRQREEPLAGEAVREQGNELDQARLLEGLEGLEGALRYRFGAEDPFEFIGKAVDGFIDPRVYGRVHNGLPSGGRIAEASRLRRPG